MECIFVRRDFYCFGLRFSESDMDDYVGGKLLLSRVSTIGIDELIM
jgi:hypothetical protein